MPPVEEKILGHEHAVLAYLAQLFPEDLQRLGEAQSCRVARQGLARAAGQGIEDLGVASQYVALSMALGSGFDHDVQLPWALEAFAPDGERSAKWMAGVAQAAEAYARAVFGVKGELYLRAMLRARRTTFAQVGGCGSDDAVAGLLARIHPEKVATMKPALAAFVRSAREGALGYGLDPGAGAAVYTASAFLLGCDFASDPCFGWAAAALAGGSASGAPTKGRALYDAVMAAFDAELPGARGDD